MPVADTAYQLGVSRGTLRRMIAAGEFPAVSFRTRQMVSAEMVMDLATAAIESGTLIVPSAWYTRSSIEVPD